MQLSVPQRTVADAGSFPTDPDDVALWLKGLRPLDSESDMREIYRGLKHSNRLHNTVDQRRAVLSCFIPVLQELHNHFNELTHAQPLPLTREFSRYARLAYSLLREEAFGYKILLTDSKDPVADDARCAMRALAHLAVSIAHTYRPIPEVLIKDANQLYSLAEAHQFLASDPSNDLVSLEEHYHFILLVSIADLLQQRVRQLPLVLDFIRTCACDIVLQQHEHGAVLQATDYLVNLAQGARPVPALSTLANADARFRCFSIAQTLNHIDRHSARIRASVSSVLGGDTLERQSLARLHVALSRSRHRRSARKVSCINRQVVFGHKEVCAHLQYRHTETSDAEHSVWIESNASAQGMCLENILCRAGLVQVGELVSVTELQSPFPAERATESTKVDALLGVVRWVRSLDSGGIRMGVEFLATSILPVRVVRDSLLPISALETLSPADLRATDISQDAGVGENALIIACKIQRTLLQTIVLPSHLYLSGDRLIASQGSRSRKVQLKKCLQSNGLFSQFSLTDANSAS